MWHSLLILLALLQPPLTARWDGPSRAVISWSGAGCLYRNQTFLACYPRQASYRIELGGARTDAAYRPEAGDVYALVRPDGAIERAALRSVTYLAVVAR